MARIERHIKAAPERRSATRQGTAETQTQAGAAQGDDDADGSQSARERLWTLDRIEKIIGSIA